MSHCKCKFEKHDTDRTGLYLMVFVIFIQSCTHSHTIKCEHEPEPKTIMQHDFTKEAK